MIFEAVIVDDEAPARVELTNQLERTGRVKVVAEAVCLQEGIARMQQKPFDVTFIDHNIAGAGSQLLPQAIPTLTKVPMLIYMTAFSDDPDEPVGIDPLAYLVKPVDVEKLDDIIALIEAEYERRMARA